jgi:hypothetical protein
MVCYARRATGILSIAIAALFFFGADTAHLFDVTGLLTSLAIVFGGAAVGAGAAFVTLRSVRRRRALAGGCVSCQLRCQHAMTGPEQQRLWLVSSAKRETPRAPQVFVPLQRLPERGQPAQGPSATGVAAGRRVGASRVGVASLPARRLPVPAADAARWPDRPTRSTVRSGE